MTKVTRTPDRKDDHLRINLEEDVTSGLTTGLERFAFLHEALPELDFNKLDTRMKFLGHPLNAPILISSMTGGTDQAAEINRRLAEAAQTEGVAMGVGSQRAAIEDPSLAPTFEIRRFAPDILVFANLGAIQLNYGYGLNECEKAIEMVGADALILHLNALQEAIQPEGDVNFENLLGKIGEISARLSVPVIVKEVGWGISGNTARKLAEAGVTGIDVAGAGGTSWSQVEMHRARSIEEAETAGLFIRWGIPTAEAIVQIRDTLPEIPLIASGGLRNGLDLAKCLALGADLCGFAGPLLQAAAHSTEATVRSLQRLRRELSIVMFATGAESIQELKRRTLMERGE
jgi:isopentenyl-diphosphate delta-isomerase